ncbi:MAG: hypothetical protein K2M93_09625 [Muribaculaceae bacterium]|nr:hypothetical protein [Muribaculaceae bacterium]
MRKNLLLTSALLAALGLSSCSNEDMPLQPDSLANAGEQFITFSLKTPTGDKVHYTRADGEMIQDAAETAINTLDLYEYEIKDDGTSNLVRTVRYSSSVKGDIKRDGDDISTCRVSLFIPDDHKSKKYTYRFVANADVAADLETPYETGLYTATSVLPETFDGSSLGSPMLMTGTAKSGENEVIEMSEGLKLSVVMTRVAARIDIKYQTPNLKITKAEVRNAATKSYLFPQTTFAYPIGNAFSTMAIASGKLPEDYLKNLEDKTVGDIKKAFYLFERENSATDGVYVHLEYLVDAEEYEYKGVLDIPFCKTGGDDMGTYVNTQRNHLYRIVLGNGDEPITGKVKVRFTVQDWELDNIDESFSTDDPIVNEEGEEEDNSEENN